MKLFLCSVASVGYGFPRPQGLSIRITFQGATSDCMLVDTRPSEVLLSAFRCFSRGICLLMGRVYSDDVCATWRRTFLLGRIRRQLRAARITHLRWGLWRRLARSVIRVPVLHVCSCDVRDRNRSCVCRRHAVDAQVSHRRITEICENRRWSRTNNDS